MEEYNYEEIISLYEVLKVVKRLRRNFEYNKFKLENGAFLASGMLPSFVEIHKNKVKIGENVFAIRDDNVEIKSYESYNEACNILSECNSWIKSTYYYYISIKYLSELKGLDIETVNSDLSANINCDDVSIIGKFPNGFRKYNFRLSANTSDDPLVKEFMCNCRSNDINTALLANAKHLFESVFVKIEDCPVFIQETLRIVRKNQLEVEEKNNFLKENMKIKTIQKKKLID